MRKLIKTTAILCCIFYFQVPSFGQLLCPKDLVYIQSNPNPDIITSFLAEKGFRASGLRKGFKLNNDKLEPIKTISWHFPLTGVSQEQPGSSLTVETDSTDKAETSFTLYNPFHFKELVAQLVESNFKFQGIKIRYNVTYSIFKRKNIVFQTTELKQENTPALYKILVYTE